MLGSALPQRLSRCSVVGTRRVLSLLPLPSTKQQLHPRRYLQTDAAPDSTAARVAPAPPERLRIVTSSTTDPFFNLATEEWLFRTFAENEAILYLWRNEPTVFIGRNQNAWKECFVQRMEEDNIHLVRRYSGGGAVYQVLIGRDSTVACGRAASQPLHVVLMMLMCDAMRYRTSATRAGPSCRREPSTTTSSTRRW